MIEMEKRKEGLIDHHHYHKNIILHCGENVDSVYTGIPKYDYAKHVNTSSGRRNWTSTNVNSLNFILPLYQQYLQNVFAYDCNHIQIARYDCLRIVPVQDEGHLDHDHHHRHHYQHHQQNHRDPHQI